MNRLSRRLPALLLWLALLAPAVPAPAAAPAASCPPVARPPSAEETRAGLRNARDRGMLWRLTRGGHASYLYGTIHVGRLDWIFPGPKVVQALHEAEAIALEIDPTDPALQQSLANAGEARAAAALPPELARRLARQVALACLPATQLAGQHPVMQAVALTVLAARREGLDPAYAQEFMLAGYARSAGKPLLSLETASLQVDTLLPVDPEESLRQLEGMLDQLEDHAAAKMLQRLGQAWDAGRLDEFEDYEAWCECVQTPSDRAFLRRLIDDRNPHLADRIAEEHRKGQRLFAAVGALHMTGPLALPTLLARAGFQVERIDFAAR